MYTERTNCRFCGTTHLKTVLELGNIYPSDFVGLTWTDEDGLISQAPLTLVKCWRCNLVQLKHTVDRDKLYRQYWYRSSLNSSMVESLKDVAKDISKYVRDQDIIVDIGCNDGIMFENFGDRVIKVGFDPALNLAEEARQRCDIFINDYFNLLDYKRTGLPRAKVVTAIAMFYDLENISDFVANVDDILRDDGVFIVQFTDLISMLKTNAFDNICHEHIEYYSLATLVNIMRHRGLQLIEVSYNDVNGASVRATFARHGKYPMSFAAMQALVKEHQYFYKDSIAQFADRIESNKVTLLNYIRDGIEVGNTYHVLGASTKGNTLLQYYGLNNKVIEYAAEINEEKFGLYTAGTYIPIISQDVSLEMNPTAYLVLPWHFINNFTLKYEEYLRNGGKMIVPLPEPRVYYWEEGAGVKSYAIED